MTVFSSLAVFSSEELRNLEIESIKMDLAVFGRKEHKRLGT